LAINRGPRFVAMCPDGDSIEAVLSKREHATGTGIDRADIAIESGLVLTDEIRAGDVVVACDELGARLTDHHGRAHRYAVRRG